MQEQKHVYVIDKLANIGQYASLSANFATAAAFLATGAFASLKPGRNEIDGENVFVNCDAPTYVLPADRTPEVHHRYFDIHVPLTDDEKIGLSAFDARAQGTFDTAKDVGFYAQDVDWHVIRLGEFCITWPITCAHAPAVTTDVVKSARKLIVKVRA